MKRQALGWLAAGVLAAGLNASYHNGGLEWAHQIADQVGYRTSAVIALATGNADQFLTEARLLTAAHRSSCPFSAAMAQVEPEMANLDAAMVDFDALSAGQKVQIARLQERRARLESEFARVRIPAVAFNPVVVRIPDGADCPRVHVKIARMPRIKMPQIPKVRIGDADPI